MENTLKTDLMSAEWTDIWTKCYFVVVFKLEEKRALALLITLVSFPIQTIKTNFSLWDSLSLE